MTKQLKVAIDARRARRDRVDAAADAWLERELDVLLERAPREIHSRISDSLGPLYTAIANARYLRSGAGPVGPE